MSYQDYQQQFVQYIEQSINKQSGDDNTKMLLVALIDSLPAYNSPSLFEALYGTFANILEMNLPNARLQQQPGTPGMCTTAFQYSGPYSGYQNAFYPGVTLSQAGTSVIQQVFRANPALNPAWWAGYSITVLTDAIYISKINVSLDTDKLSSNLGSYNTQLLPALTPAYTGVFQFAYAPTTNALNSINNAGESAAVATLLQQSILDGYFTTNINIAIQNGGDGAQAAVWFEYNLWVSLQVLGAQNVNGFIQQAINSGLSVPVQVSPDYWWNGGYTSWYNPMSGSTVLPAATATINSGFPQMSEVICSRGGHTSPQYGDYPNGYCISFCEWGSLNWYLPSNNSCFGEHTGVLMADGSVKTINNISIGDWVHSTEGPRKVVLVESPLRYNRTLYQLNQQQLFATAAHPFRAASTAGPFRYAVSAWDVLNNLPTMIEKGVGKLKPGVQLQGLHHQEAITIPVHSVQSFAAGHNRPEKVYDLILEHWEKGNVAWFAGGPDQFYAVDAETVDPAYHFPSTAGILTAMDIALPACRKFLEDPAIQLPMAFGMLNWESLREAAIRAAVQKQQGTWRRLRIPGPEYYKQGNDWCAHASALEFCLVKYFGCMLRREAATGWRAAAIPPVSGNHLTITFHDIILTGEHAIAPGTPINITLQYSGWSANPAAQINIELPPQSCPVWFSKIDQVLDLGEITEGRLSGTLIGKIHAGSKSIGTFTAPCIDALAKGIPAGYFLFNDEGIVTGRIYMEQSRALPGSLSRAAAAGRLWNEEQAMNTTISIGEQAGWELVRIFGKII